MPHMVIYRSSDGQPGYHQTEALEEAVRHVEHLRNSGEANDVRIFAMQEVPIEIKAYYRVEVHAGDSAAVQAPAPAPAPVITAEKPADKPVEKPAEQVAEAGPQEPASVANGAGRFGLFGKN